MASKPDNRRDDRSAAGWSVKSLKVHKDMWAKVQARAQADGVAASVVVRRAIASYLDLPLEQAEPVGRQDR